MKADKSIATRLLSLVAMLVLQLVLPALAFPQGPVWSGKYGHGWGTSIDVDPSGNVLVTGLSSSNVDFGGGPLVGSDMFLAKLDPEGRHLWSRGFKIESGVLLTKTSLCIDTFGNVFVTGEFQGTVDFGGGAMTSTGGTDIFLVKFGPSGNHLWSKCFGGGEDGRQMAWNITVDTAGSVVVAGEFVHSIDFGGGSLEAGRHDVFVAKFDLAGNHLWSRHYGNGAHAIGYGISADLFGNVLVTGEFIGSVDFGGGLLSASKWNMFVLKLDSEGGYVWSKRFGNEGSPRGMAITTDDMGSPIVVGDISGSVDFGGGPIASAQNTRDSFAVKFDPEGNHLWSLVFGVDESGPNITPDVSVGGSDRVVLTGAFRGVTDFGGEPLIGRGSMDIFIAVLTSDGAHVWSRAFGDDNIQLGHSVATRSEECILITGGFRGSLDFGGGHALVADTNEIFIVKWRLPSDVPATRSSLTSVKQIYR